MSKKTPKSGKAKTKSALRLIILAVLLSVLAVIFLWYNSKAAKACVQIGQNCFNLEVADTDAKRIKGLSGRENLPENKGMLFVFDEAGNQCFWMKDMEFNLDIIWLNGDKKITKIKENVSPDTYPDSFCADDTQYVLEFNRDFAGKHGLKPGTKLQF